MKLVTFARDMAPHNAGDKRLVPEAVADQLQSDGALSAVEDWPAEGGPAKPARAVLSPSRQPARRDQRIAR